MPNLSLNISFCFHSFTIIDSIVVSSSKKIIIKIFEKCDLIQQNRRQIRNQQPKISQKGWFSFLFLNLDQIL